MPGTNAGTGQPICFVCSACRKRRNQRLHNRGDAGTSQSVHISGHHRDLQHKGNAGLRNSRWAWRYTCDVCGHAGYSRHIDLERKAKAEGLFLALELDKVRCDMCRGTGACEACKGECTIDGEDCDVCGTTGDCQECDGSGQVISSKEVSRK